MKLKTVDLLTLVIWGIVSAVWIVRYVYFAVPGIAGTPWFNIFLAVIWVVSFCIMLYRYWKGLKGREK